MTAIYTPNDPKYFDKDDLSQELDRVFDLCHGCRLCFNLCPSFPTLFNFIDNHDGDATALSEQERDQVVDECYQCKLCYVKCPYVPPHEWKLDFPRLMSRVHAQRFQNTQSLKSRLTDQFLGRTDTLGTLSTLAPGLINKLSGTPGSFSRKMMEKTLGIASNRLLPPYARIRFTTWFKKHHKGTSTKAPDGKVATVFPTCFIEYMEPEVGQDLVSVYEHNKIECCIPTGTKCCGAPWLHSGNVDEFKKSAEKNISALVAHARSKRAIIVAQPTCAYVIKRDYPLYIDTDDARLVAEHTYDPAEYLMAMHREDKDSLDLCFPGRESGAVGDKATYHLPCHLVAQNIGLKSRDLLKLANIECDVVQRCSGIDGTWGYRASNYDLARKVAAPMGKEILNASNEMVIGDCHLANGSILQETGLKSLHPIQLFARAYGLKNGTFKDGG